MNPRRANREETVYQWVRYYGHSDKTHPVAVSILGNHISFFLVIYEPTSAAKDSTLMQSPFGPRKR